jgi:hypothetical protein
MVSAQYLVEMMSTPSFSMGSNFGREAITEFQTETSDIVTVKGVLDILNMKLSDFDEMPESARAILSQVEQDPAFIFGAVTSALETVRSAR